MNLSESRGRQEIPSRGAKFPWPGPRLTSRILLQVGITGNKIREVSLGPGHGNFAPRLGISWRPLDSDRFIFHAGGGVFNDLPHSNIQGSYVNNNPVFTQPPTDNTAFGSPPPLTNGAPTTTETMFANSAFVPLAQITAELMPSPFYRTPTVYEWSASIQSQLTQNWHWRLVTLGTGAFTWTTFIFGAIKQCLGSAISSRGGHGPTSTSCYLTRSTGSRTTMHLRLK